jgi:hypothetical protein
MFDMSIAFRKIGKNQYLFFSGLPYASKAYLVTYQETKLLLNIMDTWMRDVSIGTPCAAIFALRMPKLSLGIYIGLNFLRYLLYRKQIKNILGDREKVACEKETFMGYQKKLVDTITPKILLQVAIMIPVVYFLAFFCFSDYIETEEILYLLGSVFMLLMDIAAFIIVVCQCSIRLQNWRKRT